MDQRHQLVLERLRNEFDELMKVALLGVGIDAWRAYA